MFEGRNCQKTATNEEGKSALSPRQCTMSQVDCNKTTWIALQIASTPTLFSRSGLQWLLAICRPQKNAPGKEIWLQWRSDIGNWGLFWGQRQIVLQKMHRIVREALESVYHPRRRLLMNKVEFFLKVVVLLVRLGTYWVICYILLIEIECRGFMEVETDGRKRSNAQKYCPFLT